MGFKVSLWNQSSRVKGSNYQWTWGPDTLDNTDLCFPKWLLLTAHSTNTKNQPVSSLSCLARCFHCWDLKKSAFCPGGGHRQTESTVTCAGTHSSSPLFSLLLRNHSKVELRREFQVSATTLPFSKWGASDKLFHKTKFLLCSMRRSNTIISEFPRCRGKNLDLVVSPEHGPASVPHYLYNLKQLT